MGSCGCSLETPGVCLVTMPAACSGSTRSAHSSPTRIGIRTTSSSSLKVRRCDWRRRSIRHPCCTRRQLMARCPHEPLHRRTPLPIRWRCGMTPVERRVNSGSVRVTMLGSRMMFGRRPPRTRGRSRRDRSDPQAALRAVRREAALTRGRGGAARGRGNGRPRSAPSETAFFLSPFSFCYSAFATITVSGVGSACAVTPLKPAPWS